MARAVRIRILVLGSIVTMIGLAFATPRPTLAEPDHDRGDPRIVRIGERVYGRTYAEWTAAWWQWATAFPLDSNPVADTTGAFAGQGQSGPVYLLAGTFGGSAVRNITIPSGTFLFVPIANGEWDTVPGFSNPLNLPDPLSIQNVRDILAYFHDADQLFFSIDGQAVHHPRSYRVKSPVFSMNINPDFATATGYPAPYVRTAASDGYWLMLKPLAAGAHVIHFTASNPTTGFSLDVTYNITVNP
jgi:hypothetical protein